MINFYRAFEDHHRGSRELIKQRLLAYRPFFAPLVQTFPRASAFDLGCGRGEWLEVLSEAGFRAVGVDMDEGMLRACHELGLTAHQGDAIEAVRKLPTASQAIVSAFHFVEHIEFDQLNIVCAEALRVLRPGGLLIMETPNPENIRVATCNFYLDPSHHRPIPPDLLAFCAQFAGFARIKTVRLQEPKGLMDKKDINLLEVLDGVSPDYAIVAQKTGEPDIVSLLDHAFAREYGLDLQTLGIRWQRRFDQLEARAAQAELQFNALLSSRSWRITRPLRTAERICADMVTAARRWLGRCKRANADAAAAIPRGGIRCVSAGKAVCRAIVVRVITQVLRRSWLQTSAKAVLKRWPGLYGRLARFYWHNVQPPEPEEVSPDSLRTLPAQARRIYRELQKAAKAARVRGKK